MVAGLPATLGNKADLQQSFYVGDVTWSARAGKMGWLLCDGSAISRTTYADLFAEIGTAFGAGDGSTTFNLPDGQGRALIGVGAGVSLTARALGDAGGEEEHQLTIAELPAHTHPYTRVTSGGGQGGGGSAAHNSTADVTGSEGGDTPHNNMQPFLALNMFIYTGV